MGIKGERGPSGLQGDKGTIGNSGNNGTDGLPGTNVVIRCYYVMSHLLLIV